jgi:hypothetical protein
MKKPALILELNRQAASLEAAADALPPDNLRARLIMSARAMRMAARELDAPELDDIPEFLRTNAR